MKYNWKDTNQYLKVYADNPTYGNTGVSRFSELSEIILKHNIKSVLDFGCGPNATLLNKLKETFPDVVFLGYDPAIRDDQTSEMLKNEIDQNLSVELVVSTDCLEHIPKEELNQCWSIFRNLRPRFMFHVICTRKAGQILPDGTNAHKTVETGEWWWAKVQSALTEYSVEDVTSEEQRNRAHVHFFLSKR